MTHIDSQALQTAGVEIAIAILLALVIIYMPEIKRKKKWPPK